MQEMADFVLKAKLIVDFYLTFSYVREEILQVVLEVNGGEMLVRGENMEVGEAKDVLEVEYTGEPIDLSYKGDFMIDFLKSATTEKVLILFNDAKSPAGFQEMENKEYLHIIMPMKIRAQAQEVID